MQICLPPWFDLPLKHFIQLRGRTLTCIWHDEKRGNTHWCRYAGEEEAGLETPVGVVGVELLKINSQNTTSEGVRKELDKTYHVRDCSTEQRSNCNPSSCRDTCSNCSKTAWASFCDIGPTESAKTSRRHPPNKWEEKLYSKLSPKEIELWKHSTYDELVYTVARIFYQTHPSDNDQHTPGYHHCSQEDRSSANEICSETDKNCDEDSDNTLCSWAKSQ